MLHNFTWDATITNEDGTPLKDLAGYRLYENGVEVADVGNVTSCKYDIPEGSNVYTVRAYDNTGNESKDSPSVKFEIILCPHAPDNLEATKVE